MGIDTYYTDGAAWAAAGFKSWAYIDWATAGLEANNQIVRCQPVVGGAIALTVLRGSDRLASAIKFRRFGSSAAAARGRALVELTVLRGFNRLTIRAEALKALYGESALRTEVSALRYRIHFEDEGCGPRRCKLRRELRRSLERRRRCSLE